MCSSNVVDCFSLLIIIAPLILARLNLQNDNQFLSLATPAPVKPTPTAGVVTVYLVDGEDPMHGRVVVNYGNVNGTICNRGFDDNAARVICLMMGYK